MYRQSALDRLELQRRGPPRSGPPSPHGPLIPRHGSPISQRLMQRQRDPMLQHLQGLQRRPMSAPSLQMPPGLFGPPLQAPSGASPKGSKARPLWQHWTVGSVKKDASADDMAILRDPKIKPARKPHMLSLDQTVKLVFDNFKKLCNNGIGDGYKPRAVSGEDLAFTIFHDIDRVLFGGILKGNVSLQIADAMPPKMYGMTSAPGTDSCPRIKISLSRPDILHGGTSRPDGSEHGSSVLVKVLVHQMIHAFLLQCCGYKDKKEAAGYDLGHPLQFSMISGMVDYTFLNGDQPYPSLIGQSQGFRHPRQMNFRRLESPPELNNGGHTVCDSSDHGHPQSECEHNIRQCTEVQAPKVDLEQKSPEDCTENPRPITQYVHDYSDGEYKGILRSTYKSVNPNYVEVIYRYRAVAIPKAQLCNQALLSLKSGGSVELDVPDDDAFDLFYQYLTTGEYRGQAGSFGSKDHGSDMLCDMQMYRIGVAIDNAELQNLALKNLDSDWEKCDDPVPAIDYAYHGPEPENDDDKKALCKIGWQPPDALRTWVREYLVQIASILREPAQRGTRPLHVLDILEQGKYKNEWNACKEKGGCLVTDVDTVRKQIYNDRDAFALR